MADVPSKPKTEVVDTADLPPAQRAPELTLSEATQLAESDLDPQQKRLKSIEDNLLFRSLTTVEDVLHFGDLDPEQMSEPPQEWVDELGKEGAQKRLRLARAAWMNAKESPVGIKVAKEMAVGILKARGAEATSPRLAVSVQVVTHEAVYPSIEVES